MGVFGKSRKRLHDDCKRLHSETLIFRKVICSKIGKIMSYLGGNH